jgi:hypothetical protein
MHIQFKILGYLGLIPFIAMPVFIGLGLIGYAQGFMSFVQYSAIILSFFGGIHWFDALSENRHDQQVYVAMLPSIIAWLSLVFLEGSILLMVLSVSYIAILMYDKYTLKMQKETIVQYTTLRVIVTSLVVLSHLLMNVV